MSKNRTKTNLIHKDGKEIFEVSRNKKTDKLYIKNTDIEVTGKVMHKNQLKSKGENYDFSKPFQAQDLGSEWECYAWGGDDY